VDALKLAVVEGVKTEAAKTSKPIPLTFRLSPETKEAIRVSAEAEGMLLSHMTAQLVEWALTQYKTATALYILKKSSLRLPPAKDIPHLEESKGRKRAASAGKS